MVEKRIDTPLRRVFNGPDLIAVTTATTSTANFDFRGYRRITWFVNCTVNTGAVTVTVQGSVDKTIWDDLDTVTYTGAIGNNTYHYGQVTYYPFYRTKTTTQSNSTVSTFVAARD